MPGVREQYENVKSQLDTLRNHREEIESADQEELRRVREEISIVGEGVEMRRAEMQVQQQEAAKLASEEAELRKMVEACRVKIDRAERIKELNRGFEKNEVEGFKGGTSLKPADSRNSGEFEKDDGMGSLQSRRSECADGIPRRCHCIL